MINNQIKELQGWYTRLVETKQIKTSIESIKITKYQRKQFPIISKFIDGINKKIT